MTEITQSVNYRPLQSKQPPAPYRFDAQPKIDTLDGKKFRSLHNVNSEGQYTAIHSSKFQRVHPTQEEFSGKIGANYRNLVEIDSKEGVHTAKLKPNADEKGISSRIGSATRGTKEASESNEKDLHEAFRQEMDSEAAPSSRGFLSKIWAMMTGDNEKLILSKEADNTVGIKTNTSQATGDSLEVQPLPEDIKDKSKGKKIAYGIGLSLLGVGLVATGVGLPMLFGAAGLVIGLGTVGGLLGAGALAKLCSNLKSPWWAKTVDGQRQWAERKAAVDVGDGIEGMVKNQVLKGAVGDGAEFNDAEFNDADQSQWKDPALLKSEMVVGWMKLAKHNSPDEMKAKIREELLKPDRSFLHPQTIKDAKRGAMTGWWFTGNPKGHAEKTVNIVAEEIYRGVIRGLASGYMGLVEAELADAKTKTAQDELKPWLETNIEGFKSALSRFPAGVDANQPADGTLESRAFEFYETDEALAKVESYQSQAQAVQTQLTEKKDIIGEANHGVYSEVLKSFNHDVATFKDSLGVVARLVRGTDAPDGNPSLQSVNSGLGKILDTHLYPSEEMESVDQIQQRLHADLAALDGLLAKEVADTNANPALLKQHHDGLTALSAQYKGANGAIQTVAKFATTLATAENALKGNDLTRDKIQEQKESLDGLNKLSQGDACPFKTDTAVLGKISRAEGNRDKMAEDIGELDAAYAKFEQMKEATTGLVAKAQVNLREALGSEEFQNLKHNNDSVLLVLRNWTDAGRGTPLDLNPVEEFGSIKRQMVAGALGIPEGSDLAPMAFALGALCEQDRTDVVGNLKDLGAGKTAGLLTTLHSIHTEEGSDTVKAAKSYEAAAEAGIDKNVAATLAKTLYPGQAAQLENFRKFSVVLSNLDTVKEKLAERLSTWAKLEGIQGTDTSTRSGFLTLLGHEKLGGAIEDKADLHELKAQVDRLGGGILAEHADQIAGIDSDTLGRLEKLSSTLTGDELPKAITDATNRLEAQVAALNQRIGGDVGLSNAATAENRADLEVIGEVISQVIEKQDDAKIELENAELNAEQAAKAIHDLVGAKISPEEVSKKLLSNPELKQLLQLGVAAQEAVDGNQDIPSLAHKFTKEQLQDGLRKLRGCPIVSVAGVTHLTTQEKAYLTKRNKAIERIQKDTGEIDPMNPAKAEKAMAKAIRKYGAEIENFLHEERAYEAMTSLYADGTVSTADLRKLFEKHSADYQQTRVSLNRNLGTGELLGEQNLKKLDDNHLQNLNPRIKTLASLKDVQNPASIWRESAYLQGVENRLTEIRGEGKTQEAFEQAASGGLVEYGKCLHEGDAGKNATSDQLRLAYLKGQSEAVKKALKYLNPKNMEIVRPDIFRRAYIKIFNPATKYEKLVSSADLSSFRSNIAQLSQNDGLKNYLQGTLEELNEQQSILVEKRNALVGDSKKVELGLRMFAIDQLAQLGGSDADPKLTASDFDAAVARWKERLGDSQGAFSDIETKLKQELVGKSISELEANLDPESRAEFEKQLESLVAHQHDVARAHDQLAGKINAAADLVTYKEITRKDFGNSRLFVKDRDNDKSPTWMSKNAVTIQPQEKIINILDKMKNAVGDNSLKVNLATLSNQFARVEAVHGFLIDGVKDDSLELNELRDALPQIGIRVGLIKKEAGQVFNAIRSMPSISGIRSASESLRERLTVGYDSGQSAVDTMQDRLNREIAKLEELQGKLQKLVDNAMNDTDAEIGSQIGDEDVASSQESKIQYITLELGNVNGLAEMLSRVSSQDLTSFQEQAVNASTPEEKSALLAEIQAKAGNPPPQVDPANPRQPQVPAGTLSVSDIVPFKAEGIQKRANTEWHGLVSSQKLTGNQAYLNSYQHVAVEAAGYCSLTAMATYHGMKTSELINHLKVVAQRLNKGQVVEEMLNTMASDSSGFDPGKESYQEIFQEAGLSFRVINPAEIDTPSYVGKFPGDNDQVPALLFTKQLGRNEGHFDLLAPSGHLAGKINLPTDASRYVANDYKVHQ